MKPTIPVQSMLDFVCPCSEAESLIETLKWVKMNPPHLLKSNGLKRLLASASLQDSAVGLFAGVERNVSASPSVEVAHGGSSLIYPDTEERSSIYVCSAQRRSRFSVDVEGACWAAAWLDGTLRCPCRMQVQVRSGRSCRSEVPETLANKVLSSNQDVDAEDDKVFSDSWCEFGLIESGHLSDPVQTHGD